jgi:hypothetical protein
LPSSPTVIQKWGSVRFEQIDGWTPNNRFFDEDKIAFYPSIAHRKSATVTP